MSITTLNPENKKAIIKLLYQLADDDFLYAYRGSEWLGLAPHIEEDVASSSIAQDSMGHAAMFYRLLEELGEGNADDLAHARQSHERKNCILVERVNGPGSYMENAQYDWAYAVVRNYLYTTAKKVKIQSLKQSSYQPLADVAVKVDMELHYHLLHWKTWFIQLLSSTDEARARMKDAYVQVMNDFTDVFSFGKDAELIKVYNLIDTESVLKQKWIDTITPVLESVQLEIPETFDTGKLNGRNGDHTKDLQGALSILSEVYDMNPAVAW